MLLETNSRSGSISSLSCNFLCILFGHFRAFLKIFICTHVTSASGKKSGKMANAMAKWQLNFKIHLPTALDGVLRLALLTTTLIKFVLVAQ